MKVKDLIKRLCEFDLDEDIIVKDDRSGLELKLECVNRFEKQNVILWINTDEWVSK